MKTLFLVIPSLVSLNVIHAQDNCWSIKENIETYEQFIKSYETDSIRFTEEIAKYSNYVNNQEFKKKYDYYMKFLAVVKKDRLIAISSKKRLEIALKECLDSED